MNNPLPVDEAIALGDRRRWHWDDDEFASHRELTQEEQELRDQRRKQRRH
jgi:hypothetical protein